MKQLIAIGLALMTSACATTYGELGGLLDDGVAADQLSADTFRIRSRGTSGPKAPRWRTTPCYGRLRRCAGPA
jgi:hypothetical protein